MSEQSRILEKRDAKTVNFTSALVILTMTVLVFLNIKTNTYFNSYVASAFAVLSALSYFYYRKTNNFNNWANSFLIFSSLLSILIFIQGGRQGAGVLWIFIIPYFIIHFKGYKTGRWFLLAYFILLLFVFALSLINIVQLYFMPAFIIVLFFAFIFQNLYLLYFDKRWEEIKNSLVAGNEKYLALINNLSLGVVMISPEMKVIEKNSTFEKWFPSDKSGKSVYCYECLNIDKSSDYCRDCETFRTFINGQTSEIIKRKETAIGFRDFKVIATPLFDSNNKVYAVIETLEDITELIIANNALKESEAKYKLLADVTTEGIIIHQKGLIFDVNNAFCKLTGYSKDEVVGKNGIDLIVHPDSKALILSNLRKEYSPPYESKLIRKDTSLIDVEIEAYLIPHNDKILRITAVRDLTLRKEIESHLKESMKRYDALALQSRTVNWEVDREGLYTYVSPNVFDIWGYSPEELVGKLHFFDLHPIESREYYKSQGLSIILQGSTITNYENPIVSKSGEVLWVLSSGLSIFDISHNIIGFGGTDTDITQRKIAEDYLKESEEKHRFLFENMTQGVVYHDKDGKILSANKAAADILGLTIEQLFRKTSLDPRWHSIHEDGTPYLGENHPVMVTIQTQQPVRNSIMGVFIPENNSYRYININSVPKLRQNDNELFEVVVTFEDITDLKNIEYSLRKSEEKYRMIAENTSDVIWVLNINQEKFTFISPSIFQLRGLTADEAMNQSWKESMTPESLAIIEHYLLHFKKQFIENPEDPVHKIIEIQQYHKDGSLIWVEISARFNLNQNGDIEVLGVSRNIEERKKWESERKLVEDNLRDSEEKLKAVFETANIGISITDLNGKYVLFNQWWCNYLKINQEELLNLSNYDVTFEEYREISKENFEKVIRGELPSYRIEKQYRRGDGTLVWGDVSVAPIRDSDGKVAYLVGMVVDITDNKSAEERLKNYSIELEIINEQLRYSKELIEANLSQKNALIDEIEKAKSKLEISIKEKDKFFSIIAHDLKNPLGSFRNITKLLHESPEEFSDDERNELISLIKESADNVYSLLENLLEWSRSQRGKIQFIPESVFLHSLVGFSTELYKPTTDNKNLSVYNLIPKLTAVMADTAMLNTIFRNLISNAVKFTPFGGKIEIGVLDIKKPDNFKSNHQSMITVFVRDSGIGISQDIIDKLFRIDENITTKGTSGEIGTGLGLILCKEFVEMHGGRIWVESEEGNGSTFYFTLPV